MKYCYESFWRIPHRTTQSRTSSGRAIATSPFTLKSNTLRAFCSYRSRQFKVHCCQKGKLSK